MLTTPAHIFIDNSNVIGGARLRAEALEPTTPWVCIRVHLDNLFDLLEGTFLPSTRVFAGSEPPRSDALWDHARRRGYSTVLPKRVEDDSGHLVEQAVDELIHLRIAEALLDHDPPQQLVLVTGDGREAQFGSSFTDQVRRALKRDWDVEVWSWRDQLSSRFARLKASELRKEQLRIYTFDPLYMRLTFVTGNGVACYGGTAIPIRDRRVRRLEEGDRERCRIA